MRDLEIVRKFIRGALTDAFDKVLLDSAITTWPEYLQLQTFDAVNGLVELTAAKLSQLSLVIDFDVAQAMEDEADLIALLEPLMHAFDPESMFNFKNSDCTLPAKMPRELPSKYATPRVPDVPGVPAEDPVEADVEDCSHFVTFSWPAYFINYFGYRRGFQYIRQVLHKFAVSGLKVTRASIANKQGCLSYPACSSPVYCRSWQIPKELQWSCSSTC